MQIIQEKFPEIFFENVKRCEQDIWLCTPFIKKSIVEKIYEYTSSNVKIKVITNFNFASFYHGISDIDIMEQILASSGQLYNHQILQGNMYIFDQQKVIITSANLTYVSFYEQTEHTVFIEEELAVKDACNNFLQLCIRDETSVISMDTVNQLLLILSNLWKDRGHPSEKVYMRNDIARLFKDDVDKIKLYLTDWQKTVVNIIQKNKKHTFEVKDILMHEKLFLSIFPKEYRLSTKIKRTLNELRNLGLIQYIGNDRFHLLF